MQCYNQCNVRCTVCSVFPTLFLVIGPIGREFLAAEPVAAEPVAAEQIAARTISRRTISRENPWPQEQLAASYKLSLGRRSEL